MDRQAPPKPKREKHAAPGVGKIEIDREVLANLFDLAVGSMDFASGFFDDEDTATTRAVAALLGVDPMVGTPSTHRCKYGAPHKPTQKRRKDGWICSECRQGVDEPKGNT